MKTKKYHKKRPFKKKPHINRPPPDPLCAPRWEKDGGPVPLYDGITTRLLDDYQTQLVIEKISSRHNGDYTCLASNSAATRSYTATLTVNGKEAGWSERSLGGRDKGRVSSRVVVTLDGKS